jgi:hypothetical protein
MAIKFIPDTDGSILALFITDTLSYPEGHTFLTQPSDQLQFAIFNHPEGHSIRRHWHPPFLRELTATSEVLVIQSGLVKAEIYDKNLKIVHTQVLKLGDVAILFSGGHGFEVLESSTIFEIKQGPYAGIADKEVF